MSKRPPKRTRHDGWLPLGYAAVVTGQDRKQLILDLADNEAGRQLEAALADPTRLLIRDARKDQPPC